MRLFLGFQDTASGDPFHRSRYGTSVVRISRNIRIIQLKRENFVVYETELL
jgi:hypothetical protein